MARRPPSDRQSVPPWRVKRDPWDPEELASQVILAWREIDKIKAAQHRIEESQESIRDSQTELAEDFKGFRLMIRTRTWQAGAAMLGIIVTIIGSSLSISQELGQYRERVDNLVRATERLEQLVIMQQAPMSR